MIDQTQDHAKQIEMAASALSKESLADIESKLKEKTENFDELSLKFKDFEDKMLLSEEELKQKLH